MNLLEVKNLKKSFKKIEAVKGISFNVKKGEILGLLGPNGAGKSTTISMISTLIKPEGGSIHYKGKDIAKSPKSIQNNLGYVPQEIALYPMLTGKENMYFWGRSYGLRGKELKQRVEEVSGIIGIDDRLKDKVKTYSGGMKRRLNIGVALLHNPELIIMDEPTVGIDPQSRNHILDTVLALNKKGMTVIYTSHYMEEVEYLCNRICIMDQGNIIAEGSKEALIESISDGQEIHLKIEGVDEALVTTIGNIDTVKEAILSEGMIIVKAEKDPTIFKKMIDSINGASANILSMDLNEPNLEKVFLKLTGRALRD